MNATAPTDESVSTHKPRPRYIPLGEDAEGGTHLYRTADEMIFAFDAEGRREYRFDIDGRPETVEDYVAHVAAERGWYELVYGFETFVDRLAEDV